MAVKTATKQITNILLVKMDKMQIALKTNAKKPETDFCLYNLGLFINLPIMDARASLIIKIKTDKIAVLLSNNKMVKNTPSIKYVEP